MKTNPVLTCFYNRTTRRQADKHREGHDKRNFKMMDNIENEDGIIRPLHVPARHNPDAPLRERVVFALALIGKGNAADVAAKLKELGDADAGEPGVAEVLAALYEKGLVNGTTNAAQREYDMAKVTRPHTGRVDPEALD